MSDLRRINERDGTPAKTAENQFLSQDQQDTDQLPSTLYDLVLDFDTDSIAKYHVIHVVELEVLQ
jgi:hypothetical protein